jgi:transposase
MAAQGRKEYTPECTRVAVALGIEQDYTLVGAARNWEMNRDTLRRWKRELAQEGGDAFPGKGHHTPDQATRHRIQEENRWLRLDGERFSKRLRPASRTSGDENSV